MDTAAFRTAMIGAGLESYADAVAAQFRPSIRIMTQPIALNDLPMGASRLGGVPDIPPGFGLPGQLAFIGQINLSEMAAYDVEHLLPSAGWLYFFYDAENQPWGLYPEDRLGWQIVAFYGDVSKLMRCDASKDVRPHQAPFNLCALTLASEITIPDWESQEIKEAGISWDDALYKYADVEFRFTPTVSHRLLGHPDTIQGEMRLQCVCGAQGEAYTHAREAGDAYRESLAATFTQWELLLQVITDDKLGAMWGDVGAIYFWLRKQDLKERQFANTWVVLQCS